MTLPAAMNPMPHTIVGGDSWASLVASVRGTEEDRAGSFCSKEDRAKAGCPCNHGRDRPSGLQGCRVKHHLLAKPLISGMPIMLPRRSATRAWSAASLRQAAELVHVARARGVLHRAGSQKQPALEESVIEAMQQAGGKSPVACRCRCPSSCSRSGSPSRRPTCASKSVCTMAYITPTAMVTVPIQTRDSLPHANPPFTGHAPKLCMRQPDKRRPSRSRPRAATRSPEWARPWLRESCMQWKLHGFRHQRNQHQHKNAAGEGMRYARIGPERAAPCGDRSRGWPPEGRSPRYASSAALCARRQLLRGWCTRSPPS